MKVLQERILKTLFVLIWVLALTHMSAEYYYLYWRLGWFDILTHFLGGLWLGIASIWLLYFSGYVRKPQIPGNGAFLTSLFAGLLIGIVWELYEYVVWQWSGLGIPINYIPDTTLDLLMDFIGSGAGFFVVKNVLKGVSPRRQE
jgi:magnesium-transporting ATPase (P-type)